MHDMAENVWSAPTHPDPPEDRPIGVDPDPAASAVDMAPVTVTVEFTRTGPQTLPGFVERASDEKVFVQLVHMGFPHRVWLDRARATTRRLKPRRA